MKPTIISKNCAECNKEIQVYWSRLKQYNYCSRKCCAVFHYKVGIRDGQALTARAHQILREKGHYKRDNTYLSARGPSSTPEARKKISEARLKSNWMRGRKSPFNMGGSLGYRGHRWNEIKAEIKKRDNYACVRCRMTERTHFEINGQPLQVDHIMPYRVSRDNSSENLQTLCCSCHGKKWSEDLKKIKEYRACVLTNK